MHEKPLPEGTRIRFVRELTQGPTGDTPAFLFAKEGEEGEIVDWEAEPYYPYEVKTDSFPEPFRADVTDFEVID